MQCFCSVNNMRAESYRMMRRQEPPRDNFTTYYQFDRERANKYIAFHRRCLMPLALCLSRSSTFILLLSHFYFMAQATKMGFRMISISAWDDTDISFGRLADYSFQPPHIQFINIFSSPGWIDDIEVNLISLCFSCHFRHFIRVTSHIRAHSHKLPRLTGFARLSRIIH